MGNFLRSKVHSRKSQVGPESAADLDSSLGISFDRTVAHSAPGSREGLRKALGKFSGMVRSRYASTELVRERFDNWLDITHIELVVCEPS